MRGRDLIMGTEGRCFEKIMQLLKNCIGPTIRIGREILCLLYAGFYFYFGTSTKAIVMKKEFQINRNNLLFIISDILRNLYM